MDPKRLNAAEQVALYNLEAAIKAIELAKPLAQKRMNMPGAKAMFYGAEGSLKKLLDKIKGTMPDERA